MAGGPEIRQYAQDVVKKFNLDKHAQLETSVLEAAWNEADGKWDLKGALTASLGQKPNLKACSQTKRRPCFRGSMRCTDWSLWYAEVGRKLAPNSEGLS